MRSKLKFKCSLFLGIKRRKGYNEGNIHRDDSYYDVEAAITVSMQKISRKENV